MKTIPLLLSLILLFVHRISGLYDDVPKSLHKTAISKAKAGNLEESLQFFRAASRADPTNYEYMNNLGVTEMRVGSFRKAAYRFFTALQLSRGQYMTAWDNLAELKEFLEDENEYEKYYTEWLGRSDDNKVRRVSGT